MPDLRRRPVLVALLVLVGWCRPAAADDYPHLLLGNPSRAKTEETAKDNYLMKKEFFAVSYNGTRGTPNWVSWRVSKADLGEAPRKRTFDPDATLPEGFTRVTHKDYTGSGFDRGHLCPHSDRAADRKMSYATFVMTNVVPQAPNLNQKAWNQMEIYLRDLVSTKDRRLYVVAGVAGTGGRGKLGFRTEIAEDRVAVPALCWKIAVVVDGDAGGGDLARVTADTRVIAVVMPNDNSVGYAWAQYRTSVRQVERLTGYTFFDRLPPDVAKALKEEPDDAPIPPPVPPVRGDD